MMPQQSSGVVCSIIIPVYNGERFIDETLVSCLNQTEKSIEIIAVDDASSDSSWDIMCRVAANEPRLILKRNTENLGISKTVNIGTSSAKGEYILILGQDDLLLPQHVETMISEFDDDTSFVHCNADLIDSAGMFLCTAMDDQRQIKINRHLMVYLSFTNVISSTGLVISKRHFDAVSGIDEKYRNYHEFPLWIKLADIGKVKYTTKIRAKYRIHDESISNTFLSVRNIFLDDDVIKERERFRDEYRQLALKKIRKNSDKILRVCIYVARGLRFRGKQLALALQGKGR